MGSVIAQYLSKAITDKFKMEAVLANTSNECQASHQLPPYGQYCTRWGEREDERGRWRFIVIRGGDAVRGGEIRLEG